MSLTQKQHAIIVGAILGDSAIEKAWKNPRIRFAHSICQKEYLFWKYGELRNISSKPALIQEKHWKNGKIYESWQFNTHASDELQKYWQEFYRDKKKVVMPSLVELLRDPLSLAVWFMDDGYKRNDCNALRLSTDAFSMSEQELLQSILERNFHIPTKLHKKGKYWNIYIPQTSARRFVAIVRPYILPSMAYKIHLAP